MNIEKELIKVAKFLEDEENIVTSKIKLLEDIKNSVKKFLNGIKKTKVPMKELTEEEKMVSKNGNAIKDIKNPSIELQLLAVKNKGEAIKYIKNPSEEVQLEAINNSAYAMYYIENPTSKVKKLADEICEKNGWDKKDKEIPIDKQERYLYQSLMSLSR